MKFQSFTGVKFHQQERFRSDRVSGGSNNHPEGLGICRAQTLAHEAVPRHGRHLRRTPSKSHQIEAGVITLIKVERRILGPESRRIVLGLQQRSTVCEARIPHIHRM